ncbi:MAG: hypothetical protein ASARMPREDX12_000301 [Alectoria sarmentosa]|nr:MAG: hypothetical protein ASARMPREDX12_000301 [Alectoria sarmentosa]
MNRFRRPTFAQSSKATAQTLCQKCLKKDNYECKAPAQDRPYTSRPSRTQQLVNPKLIPKLTSDTPNGLLRKKGVADEVLAKREEERGRERKANADEHMNGSKKRSRSNSSYSSNSVSTISTNLSRSSSPKLAGLRHTGQSQVFSNLEVDREGKTASEKQAVMVMLGKGQANVTLVNHWPLNASKQSIQGPGPCLMAHTRQRIRGGRNPRIARLGGKGVDIHPEVLWIVEETGTSIATEAVDGRGALARAGTEVKSSETGSP